MVEAVICQLDCVLFIGLGPPQTVVPVAMHQHGVHYGDVESRIVKEAGNRQMVVPGGLHHDAGLAVQVPSRLDSLHNSASVCPTSKGGITISPKGRMTAIMLLPLETSTPTQFTFIPPIQNLQPEPIFFSLPIQSIG